ncbi:hypothetical protein GCM10027590_62980 [Nocardiopsis nanhaiensis]
MSGMNTLLVSSAVIASDFDLDSDTVTPGVLGFLAIFAIGVALYFLMRSLLVKLRGVSARAEEQEAAEEAEAQVGGADTAEDAESSEKGAEGEGTSGADASGGGSAAGSAAEDTSAKS